MGIHNGRLGGAALKDSAVENGGGRAGFRTRLRSRATVFGAWTSFGHPGPTEIFAASGVDFVGIDLEHSTISQEQAQRIIAASHAAGVACLPRLAWHDGEAIKRLADSGADGFIAPMVSTVAEIDQLVQWIKYPPRGRRSFGIARAQGYGVDFGDYTSAWNDRSTLVVQIESVDGVENVEAIARHEDVDGLMIGPYDLSGSLGVPGQLDHPSMGDALKTVIAACKTAGKPCGTQLTAPDDRAVQRALADGYTFIVLASDVFVLWRWSEAMSLLIGRSRAK